LSTTEAEYCALSEAMRQVIPLLDIQQECVKSGLLEEPSTPEVFCTAFKDNSGALEMARVPKMRPRTKHINLKYLFFRSRAMQDGDKDVKGKVHIKPIDMKDQQANLWTKSVCQELFLKFRKAVMGW